MTYAETFVGALPLNFIKRVEIPPGNGYWRVYTSGIVSENKLAMHCSLQSGEIMWLPVKALRIYWHANGSPRLYCQYWAIKTYHARHSSPVWVKPHGAGHE